MALLNLPESALQSLEEGIREAFDYQLLSEGFSACLKGAVNNLNINSGFEITASYQERNLNHKVYLDADFLGISSCSCGSETYCSHMAAVFFKVYEMSGKRPELLMHELALEHEVHTKVLDFKKRNGRTKAPETKTPAKQLASADPGASPSSWHQFFESKMKIHWSSVEQQGIHAFTGQTIRMLFPLSDSWEANCRCLYRVHVLLFCIAKSEQFNTQLSGSYYQYYFQNSYWEAQRLINQHFIEALKGIQLKAAQLEYTAHFDAIRGFLAEHAFPERPSLFSWHSFYRFVWGELLLRQDWITDERKRLELSLKKAKTDEQRDLINKALGYFDFMHREYDSALGRYGKIRSLEPSELDLYLHALTEERRWDMLLQWLKLAVPFVGRRSDLLSESFFQYWVKGARAQADDREWRRIMQGMMPGLYQEYADYLLSSGRADELVRLHVTKGYRLYNLDPKIRKRLEQDFPEQLLPLYHQEAELYILQKNREAYGEAVRILKKLAALYKKRRETDRWQSYLEFLTSKYSRMRAFQEELRKGKLIV